MAVVCMMAIWAGVDKDNSAEVGVGSVSFVIWAAFAAFMSLECGARFALAEQPKGKSMPMTIPANTSDTKLYYTEIRAIPNCIIQRYERYQTVLYRGTIAIPNCIIQSH